MRKDHQKFTREYLAYAIFKKILEMEHNYQMELKRRLEATAQKERVQRVKVGRSRRAVEHYMPVLSPHPPVAPKANHGSCVVIDQVYSSSLKLALPRPNTAPGRPSTAPANMQQRPSRLQPLLSHPTSGVTLKPPSVSRSKPSLAESEGRFPNGGERYRNPSEHPHGVAPYQLPIINEYLMPVPPPPSPRNEKMINKSRIEAWRRRVRPTTAPNIPDPHRDSGRHHKSPLHSNAFVTMIYWGKSVHLNHDDLNYKDEIKIYQQHCGGENLCVFQGKLLEKETFQFISKRHFGFPFSLTFFLNGMQLDRLSSCCEFKHRRGSRLGGKNGYFGFVDIDGASPCYKCIISMGLDKKPFPPPKKEKEMMEVNEVTVKEEATKVSESFNEEVENVGPTPTTCSSPEDDKVGKLVEEEVERDQEIEIAIPANNTEASFRDDYDEDFEADDEKSNEKVKEDGQTDDQMNGRSKSPSDDEKDNLDNEKESETSFQEIRETSDYMKYDIDGCSDNDLEDDKQARQTSSSGSSRSNTYSSSGEDMSEMGDGRTCSDQSQEETQQENPYFRDVDEEDKVEYSLSQEVLDEKEIESKRMDPEGISEDQGAECHSSLKEILKKSTSGGCRDQASGEGKEEEEDARWSLAKTAKEMDGTMAGLSKVDEGGDLKSIQEEIRESAEEDELRPSEAELNDSSTDEAQEGWRSSLDRSHKDGDLLAEETTALEMALEESKHVAPEGEQLKRGEAFEGVMIPEPKKAEPEAGLGGPRTRKRKEEEKEEVEVGEEGKKEEGEEEAEKEQEEEEEEVLGRGWMVVITTSTPRALAEVADLTKEREVVPKVHWEVEETGAKGEGFTSKEEEEVTERTRTSQIVTKAASPEEGSWKDKGSERKEAAIQEEKNVGKANKESQGDPGEVRHESKTAIHSEGRMEEMANQKEIEKLEEEEAEGERGCREAVSPSRKDMAAWREAPEMEELKGTKETIFKRKEMCPEEQKGGENAATLRGVSPVEKGADLEAGPPKGAEKETAAMGEEIMTEEETEPLNEIVREAMFQREAVTPLVTDEDKEIFEPLKETTNGKEDSEEKECESKKGGEKGVEPGDRAAFHRERAENENKLSAGEAASEVRESSGKAGSPGEKEEAESEDGDTGYGATGEVTCSAKGENEEEEQEMELPAAGVGRSPNNREGEPGDQGTPEEESTTLPERVETLGQIRAKGREPPAKTWPAALDDPGTPGEEAASAPGTGTPPKHERQEGEAVPEGPAEAEPGAAGGMAAAAPEREPLAEEGDPEENRASSPSDVAVGETWPRRDQLIKKTAAAGSGPVEEEGNGDWGPAGEEAGGKVAPETEPAAREGAFQRALVVQARKRDRDQKGGTVRKYWMRENGQAAEAGGGEGESTLGSQEPGPPKGGPKSQIPQATETMTVGKMAEIRRKQNSSARREGTDLRN
ncbi:glutamate-rich protein 3 isoform X3 [Sarcophilus harrisii]|nr:glutamate-rich protein 3 isoform X3 [Sarcophilus harrisii]XP_031824728.1 glutamate-rich protein 3 isoform X3 [Sarcophilus harrisii]XP_031824729.1 glutamate-rich protein 3 isoform X3 [Sarcophilus harrisii]